MKRAKAKADWADLVRLLRSLGLTTTEARRRLRRCYAAAERAVSR